MPVSVVVPVPIWLTPPVPLMALPRLKPASLRLKAKVPLLLIAPAVDRARVVPPLPNCNVPALIVVVPRSRRVAGEDHRVRTDLGQRVVVRDQPLREGDVAVLPADAGRRARVTTPP